VLFQWCPERFKLPLMRLGPPEQISDNVARSRADPLELRDQGGWRGGERCPAGVIQGIAADGLTFTAGWTIVKSAARHAW
jgi:hypothetical protein